ncbi:MAG: D-alanyl-D-alanine carboxypeptidase [Clostridia bacterium]|nr:D-alanyl-D-alanine carboxypeptidase [Clostridia bacterium]
MHSKKIICFLLVTALVFAATPTVFATEIPAVSAQSAVLYEPQSGRFLYEKQADKRRAMASTTKLMTALVAAEILPMQKDITVPTEAVLVEGTALGLRGGDTISVKDLLVGMLLSSGNDAANVLALQCGGSLPAFAQKMNQKAALLGMTQTQFVTPSGLDATGHLSTARDMAYLGAAVLQVPILAEICAAKQQTVQFGNPKRTVTLKNHNRLLSLYPDAIGLKTGFTKKAGRCLVSAARRNGVTLVAVTLHASDDWNDHIALYEYGFSQMVSIKPSVPLLPSLSVAGGEKTKVSLTVTAPKPIILMKNEQNEISTLVTLPVHIWAPVAAGDTVGSVTYQLGSRVLQTVPILAEESIAVRIEKSFYQKWVQQLMLLLKSIIGVKTWQ